MRFPFEALGVLTFAMDWLSELGVVKYDWNSNQTLK